MPYIVSQQQAFLVLKGVVFVYDSAASLGLSGHKAVQELKNEIARKPSWIGNQGLLLNELMLDMTAVADFAKKMLPPTSNRPRKYAEKIAANKMPLPEAIQIAEFYVDQMYRWIRLLNQCSERLKVARVAGIPGHAYTAFPNNMIQAVGTWDAMRAYFGPQGPARPAMAPPQQFVQGPHMWGPKVAPTPALPTQQNDDGAGDLF